MEWLSQSWLWIVATVGVFWLFTRVGRGSRAGGCCSETGHEKAGEAKAPAAAESSGHKPSGRGGCC